jgi:hypothetical protein
MKILSNKEYDFLKTTQRHFEIILRNILEILHKLEEYNKAIFILNELGSGIIEYKIGDKTLEFNEFTDKFKGFKLNGKDVSFKKVFNLLSRT